MFIVAYSEREELLSLHQPLLLSFTISVDVNELTWVMKRVVADNAPNYSLFDKLLVFQLFGAEETFYKVSSIKLSLKP